VTTLVVAVVVFDTVYFAEHRKQIRHEIHGGSEAEGGPRD
jgi:hypothetical protein